MMLPIRLGLNESNKEDIQTEWAKSIDETNQRAIRFDLHCLWECMEEVPELTKKASEVKQYLITKWRQEHADIKLAQDGKGYRRAIKAATSALPPSPPVAKNDTFVGPDHKPVPEVLYVESFLKRYFKNVSSWKTHQQNIDGTLVPMLLEFFQQRATFSHHSTGPKDSEIHKVVVKLQKQYSVEVSSGLTHSQNVHKVLRPLVDAALKTLALEVAGREFDLEALKLLEVYQSKKGITLNNKKLLVTDIKTLRILAVEYQKITENKHPCLFCRKTIGTSSKWAYWCYSCGGRVCGSCSHSRLGVATWNPFAANSPGQGGVYKLGRLWPINNDACPGTNSKWPSKPVRACNMCSRFSL